MTANRMLARILGVVAFVVLPVQLISTAILGILVPLTLGLLMIPLSILWLLLLFPMLGASRIASRSDALRNVVGIIGIPWAIVSSVFVCIVPAMGHIESRCAKLMLTDSWPYTWEFWEIRKGGLSSTTLDRDVVHEIAMRLSRHGGPAMEETVEAMLFPEAAEDRLVA